MKEYKISVSDDKSDLLLEALTRLMGVTASKIEAAVEAPAFSWDKFKAGEIAVHCDTEEKAKAFISEAHKLDMHWSMSEGEETHWDVYKSKTTYSHTYDSLGYGCGDYAKERGMTIIPYPFYREASRPAKVGEWVKVLTTNGHSNGTGIFRVERTEKPLSTTYYYVNGQDHDCIRDDQCVVIEGYAPPASSKPLTVTHDMLVSLRACSAGLADFDKRFPSGSVDWDTLIADHVARGETGRKEWLEHRRDKFEKMQGELLKYCSTCKNLRIINKSPVYAYCPISKVAFELYEDDSRRTSCAKWCKADA